MRKIFLLFIPCILLLTPSVFSQNVGIGTTTPNASAALDIQSTIKGLLLPRMTSIQRYAISSPTPGLILLI